MYFTTKIAMQRAIDASAFDVLYLTDPAIFTKYSSIMMHPNFRHIFIHDILTACMFTICFGESLSLLSEMKR